MLVPRGIFPTQEKHPENPRFMIFLDIHLVTKNPQGNYRPMSRERTKFLSEDFSQRNKKTGPFWGRLEERIG